MAEKLKNLGAPPASAQTLLSSFGPVRPEIRPLKLRLLLPTKPWLCGGGENLGAPPQTPRPFLKESAAKNFKRKAKAFLKVRIEEFFGYKLKCHFAKHYNGTLPGET